MASLLFFLSLAYFWIKKSIKRKYKDTLAHQEIDELKKRIEQLEKENRKLEEENKRLSSIIHKDNKLMNAMLLSVNRMIDEVSEENDPEKRRKKCEDIRKQLMEVAGERADALSNYEFSSHKLPDVGSNRINNILFYFHQRAFNEKIAFELSADAKFMKTLNDRISEEDLSTLLSDLLENAIIATKSCERRNILLSLHMPDGYPVIAVYDSGVPFPEEVRAAWGTKRVTTHSDGSGIGMMTTYEICTKNRAEFLIQDSLPGEQFTKCISVSFP